MFYGLRLSGRLRVEAVEMGGWSRDGSRREQQAASEGGNPVNRRGQAAMRQKKSARQADGGTEGARGSARQGTKSSVFVGGE